jgi:hypothetical protein
MVVPACRKLALAALLGLACGQIQPEGCPGTTLAELQLHGVLATTDCLAPPAEWPWAPRSAWPLLVPTTLPEDPNVPTFPARITSTGGDAIAYCSGGSHASPLPGTLAGTHVTASRTLPGAVLASCSAACQLVSTMTVDGELTAGSPASFAGTFTETLAVDPAHADADCGACAIPCTSTYTLTGGT